MTLQNFFTSLKQHISHRLRPILQGEGNIAPLLSGDLDLDSIFFNKDTMYRHNIMRINYTTYDVRRSQDTINPKTDHRDIMLLTASTDSGMANPLHQYRYARVLGIYHVNVIYGGRSMVPTGYRMHHMEFLWVRWFKIVVDTPSQQGWVTGQLDQLCFPTPVSEDSFGFVDPSQVLRACHVVQRFALGQPQSRASVSGRARYNADDWRAYYVNRWVHSMLKQNNLPLIAYLRLVDRDMLMRYHWGSGVGHTYSHGSTIRGENSSGVGNSDDEGQDANTNGGRSTSTPHQGDGSSEECTFQGASVPEDNSSDHDANSSKKNILNTDVDEEAAEDKRESDGGDDDDEDNEDDEDDDDHEEEDHDSDLQQGLLDEMFGDVEDGTFSYD